MAERELIVDKEKIEYEGIFNVKELMRTITDYLSDKSYLPIEKRHVESVKASEKFIEFELAPYKKVTDYAKNIFNIKVIMSNLKEVVVEKEKKKKMHQGKVQIIIDAYVETDYEQRWETKPLFYFIRMFFDKYFYSPFVLGFGKNLKEDADLLKNNIKAFLNLYKIS